MIPDRTKENPKLIQSYVVELFFVSTAYRQSSSAINPCWYYETMVFQWDKETRKTGDIVHMDEHSFPEGAIRNHFEICRKLAKLSDNSQRDAIDKLFEIIES